VPHQWPRMPFRGCLPHVKMRVCWQPPFRDHSAPRMSLNEGLVPLASVTGVHKNDVRLSPLRFWRVMICAPTNASPNLRLRTSPHARSAKNTQSPIAIISIVTRANAHIIRQLTETRDLLPMPAHARLRPASKPNARYAPSLAHCGRSKLDRIVREGTPQPFDSAPPNVRDAHLLRDDRPLRCYMPSEPERSCDQGRRDIGTME